MGLFQRRSKVATWRQPRAEQVRSASSVLTSSNAIVSNVTFDRIARNHIGFGWRFLSCGQLWRLAARGLHGGSPTRSRASVRLIGDHDRDQRQEDGTGEQDPAKYSGNEDHADEAGRAEGHRVGISPDSGRHLLAGAGPRVGDQQRLRPLSLGLDRNLCTACHSASLRLVARHGRSR